MKILLKSLTGLSTVAVLSALLYATTDVWSYIGTATGMVHKGVKNSVPVDFEIARLRDMIDDIQPDIKANLEQVTKEEVELQMLDEKIAAMQKQHQVQENSVRRLTADLKTGKSSFSYAGHTYTEDQVRADLVSRFSRFKTARSGLESLAKIRDSRKKGVEAAKQKIEAMRSARQSLLAEVEALQAQEKLVEVAKASNSFTIDDSRLGKARELLNTLRTRIETDRKLAAAEDVTNEISINPPVDKVLEMDDIVSTVDAFLTPKTEDSPSQVAEVE